MKPILAAFLFFLIPQSEPITVPKVEHKTESYTYTTDTLTRTCPDGYEGHFVDLQIGFGDEYWFSGYGLSLGAQQGYTICFKKDFMDKVRKNPEMIANRPALPKGI